MAIKFLSDTTHKKGDIHIDGNSSERLDLDSGVKITGQYTANSNTEYTYINMYNGGDASINIGTKHNLGYISFESGNGAYTERMRITNTGNVGIGTTDPAAYADSADDLVVRSSGDTGITIATTNSTKETNLYFSDGTTGDAGYKGGFQYKHEDDSLRTLVNGSERMRITSTGNVGIGTTSPAYKLDVRGKLNCGGSTSTGNYVRVEGSATGNTYDVFYGKRKYPRIRLIDSINGENNEFHIWNLGNQLRFGSNAGSSDTASFYIKHGNAANAIFNGAIGIGTDNPSDLLHIKSTSTDARMILDGHTGSDAELKFFEGGSSKFTVGYDAASTNFVIGTANVDTNQRLVIDSSGNVGIGTTSPGAKLHVNGTVRVNNEVQFTNDQMRIYRSSNDMRLRTGSSDRMTIDSTGNVGIATTSPNAKLQVGPGTSNGGSGAAMIGGSSTGFFNALSLVNTTGNSDGRGVRLSFHNRNSWSATGAIQTIQTNSTQAALSFMTYSTSLTEKMRITSDGKVGIGTTSPSAPLHISQSSTSGVKFSRASHDDIDLSLEGSNRFVISNTTDGLDLMALMYDTGRVGIGTTSPDEKLHVSGNAKATNYYIADQIIHTGDTDTYVKFDTNRIRLYAGGTAKFDSNVTYADQTDIVNYFKSITNQGNVLNTSKWSKDSTGNVSSGWTDFGYPYSPEGTWSKNGSDAENTRSIETIPGGVGVVWQTPSNDADSNADGGWNVNINDLHYTKSYRSVVYFRKTDDSTNGQFYHGCGGESGQTESLAGVAQNNPYFTSGLGMSNFIQGRWYVAVGIIQAHQSSNDGTSSGWSGVYDCQTGKKIHSGTEYMMGPAATTQRQRTYQYYSTDTASSCEWWGPRFEELNGNEPSIAELIAKGRTDHFTFHRNFDPTLLSELNESTDATDDKIFLWDESADQWKYMTLDNLQDSIDTTGGGTINNDDWSGTDLAIANGGTGASSASAARTNLGLGTAATAASTDFISATADDTMAGTLTITGSLSEEQALKTTNGRIQLGPQTNGAGIWFDRTSDDQYWFAGLSSSDGTNFRLWRGSDKFVLNSSGNLRLNNYGSGIAKFDGDGNITSGTINDGNWSGTDLAIANGGTGASTASAARTNLGLGTAATSASTDFVAVTGDTMTGNLIFNNNVEIRQKDSGGTQRTIIELDSSNDLNIGGSYAGALKFIGGGSYTEVMRIHDDGNVGIGTTTPTHLLHVNGDGKFDGNIIFASQYGVRFNDAHTRIYTNTDSPEDLIIEADQDLHLSPDGRTLATTRVEIEKSSTHVTQGTISGNDAHLDLYNNWESNTDQKGSIITFTDNYYDGTNYNKTLRAAIKGGTDTVGNTADGYLEFYTDSAGANTPNLVMRLDKSKAATFYGNVEVGSNNINLGDSGRVRFGASTDLEIYHDGSNSYILDDGTGGLYIKGSNFVTTQSASGENMIKAIADGAVELYHNNGKKLETTSAGVDVTGSISADGGSIAHATTAIGLDIFTSTGGVPTERQIRIGRSGSQYWGVQADDSVARLIHRQDETDATIHQTRFEIWSSSTGAKKWEWHTMDNAGSNGNVRMSLNDSSELTLGGGSNTITNTKVGQWDTAYGWGDHSTQGYSTTDTQLTDEQVQDIVGAMFSGNTETNITATYQDGDGTIDLVVADADNYRDWNIVDQNDTSTRVESQEYVKFEGADITGTGTSGDPFLVTTPNTTYTADGNYGMTLSGTAFRLENDRRRNSTSTDIYTGNTHDYTFYDADIGIRWYTAGAEEMRLENDGDLHVDGDVIAYSTTVSDARLKDDVQTIRGASGKVAQLRGVEYTWNEGSRKGQREIGVIAQEVEKVVPEIVHEKKLPFAGDEVYKTVDYEKMVALLIESNKEMQRRIETLEEKLNGITK